MSVTQPGHALHQNILRNPGNAQIPQTGSIPFALYSESGIIQPIDR